MKTYLGSKPTREGVAGVGGGGGGGRAGAGVLSFTLLYANINNGSTWWFPG